MRRNSILVLSMFLLSACTQATNAFSSNSSFIKTLNATNYDSQKQELFKLAEAAPNPRECKLDPDTCHFQYLNQRSFSISKSAKNNNTNEIDGGYGTGWFLDREVGTNNFWIATNIHVGTNLSDDVLTIPEDQFRQPNLVSFQIGKQDYLLKNNNSRTDVLLDGNFKPVQFAPTYYDSNNRLLLQSHTYSYNAPTPSNSETNGLGYFLNLKRLYNYYWLSQYFQFNKFGRITTYLANEILKDRFDAYHDYDNVNSDILDLFSNETNFQSDFFTENKLLSLKDFWSEFFESLSDDENGIASGTKLITEDNAVPYDKLSDDEKTLLQNLYKPSVESQKTFIDAMILKVTIDDETLARWFPYFLDPAKYNEWTFPRFSSNGSFDVNNSNDIEINSDVKKLFQQDNQSTTKKYYRAGYPVEQVNGNLIYKSKGGPIFKTTTISPIQIEYPDAVNNARNLGVDYLKIDPKDNIDSSDNNAKVSGYDLFGKVSSGASREAGGGSSGSLVIDKDYNAVGIHWGSLSNRFSSVYNREPGLGIFTAFNVPDHTQNVLRTYGLDQVEGNEQWVFRTIIAKTFFNNYAIRTAKKLLKKYNARTDKSNGMNFDDTSAIFADLEKVNSGMSTGHTETATNHDTDGKKQKAIIDALWAKLMSNYGSTAWNYLDILETLSKDAFDYMNQIDILNISVKGTGSLGYTDIKTQLETFFKDHKVNTYNLNKVNSV